MYLRDVTSKRKHGPDAVYVQLVEGYRDPDTSKVKTRILHSFGRKEGLDLDQIRRLVDQLLAYLPPEDQPELSNGFELTDTWQWGGPHLLDGLWRELELDAFFAEALTDREFETDVERAIFTLLAQRALLRTPSWPQLAGPGARPGSRASRRAAVSSRSSTSTAPWTSSTRRWRSSGTTSTSRSPIS